MTITSANTSTASTNKSWGNIIIRICISIGLIVWLGFQLNWESLWLAIRQSNLFYIFLALLAIQITVFSSIWKWRVLLNASFPSQSNIVPFSYLGKLYYIGLFFNNFLPSSVGGDVARVFYLGKRVGVPPATASVSFERLTSGAALVMILLSSAFFVPSVRPFLGAILGVAFAFLLIFFVLWAFVHHSQKKEDIQREKVENNTFQKWSRKGRKLLLELGQSFGDYGKQGVKWWILIVALSFAFQLGLVWINGLLFQAFHIEVPVVQLVVIITLISALTMLPVSINGLGVREVSYVFFFQQLGIAQEIALSVSLLFFILVSLTSIIGGFCWVLERRNHHEAIREPIH